MANEKDQAISKTMDQILLELQGMRAKLPNGEMKIMQRNLEDLGESQKEMKNDLSELKKKLLDPNDGVIVRVNENTKFRIQEEDRFEDYMKINVDVQDLKKWQSGINKAMWIIFGALIAIAVKVIFGAV
jgi:hypothetical protein